MARVPVFESREAARAWHSSQKKPYFSLLTTWHEVEDQLFPAVMKLTGVRHVKGPDAALNTLRYLFFHTRCGVWVSIRANRVEVFQPFANAGFRNDYSARLILTPRDLPVDVYVLEKARVLGRAPEKVIPDKARWWLNGGILCNVLPPGPGPIWGDEYLFAIKDMLDETCAGHPVPDMDFFINKRDYPQLCRDGRRDAYGAFTGVDALSREVYAAHAPIFSFYTGTAMADVSMPCTEDWTNARGVCFPPGSAAPVRIPARAPCPDPRAVFRGTATGRGTGPDTNVRLRLAQFSREHPDLLDAGVTGYNTRDKVVATDGSAMVVDFFREKPTVPLSSFIPMDVQLGSYLAVVYADGHCAASRYGTLMLGPAVILRVESEHPDTCGHLWLFEHTQGAAVEPGPVWTPPDGIDHLLIRPDLSNLEASIQWVRAHPEATGRIVATANARAPTVASITHHWYQKLWASAKACALEEGEIPESEGEPLPPLKAWFSPYEKYYARMGRVDATRFSSV